MIYKRGTDLVLNLKWASIKPGNMEHTMKECKDDGIEFLIIVGWPEKESLEFLSNQDFIKAIHISLEGNIDISPINNLKKLEHFQSDYNRIVGKIDFRNFPMLKSLKFGYSDYVFENFHTLTNVIHLRVNNWSFENLQNITHLSKLEVLELDFAKRLASLSGIETFNKLEVFSIYSAQMLEDISQLVSNAGSLKRLSLELVKKIRDFHVLDKLNNLERFYINRSSPIHSVQWIKKIENLTNVYIGTEVLDADIEILKERNIKYLKVKKYSKK